MGRVKFAVFLVFALLLNIAQAGAGGDDISLNSQMTLTNSNEPIRLTSNKNALVRLDQDAASVMVNNPLHASIMLDTPRLMIIVPHQPGTTSFTVLNSAGETVMEKDIIVTNVQPKYVRIRRMCQSNNRDCVPNAYYYCPDGCYEVTPVAPGSGGPMPQPTRRASPDDGGNGDNAPAVILDQTQ